MFGLFEKKSPPPKKTANKGPLRAPVKTAGAKPAVAAAPVKKSPFPPPSGLPANRGVVAVRRAVAPHEPNDEQLGFLLEHKGKVVTNAGAELEIQPNQRKFIAALDNGSLVVAKSAMTSAAVSSARKFLEQGGYKEAEIYLVDLEVVRKIYEQDDKQNGAQSERGDTARMQKAVIELIRSAANLRCSDVHIMVDRNEAQIRIRSDGIMMPLRDLTASVAMDLLQAAFYMADASDAQYKLFEYQGARISNTGKFSLPEGVQAVRLQFNPLPDNGRYLVMRLLYGQKIGNQDVDQLGYSRHQVRQIKQMRAKPYGIVVISGPTGSGKSTTLQTALQATAREKNYEVNIITVEDPPEYEIKGTAQLPVVNVKTEDERHEAFRAAIAASLRSDPDIIMIGEIRDSASASLAFQAAMTGHQVWASLHANDALSILDRLRDNKVETFKLSDPSLVVGLIGQRLIRKLCDNCKLTLEEAERRRIIDPELVAEVRRALPDRHVDVCVANPDGCSECSHRGSRGRTVAAETINPDREFMSLIAREMKHEAYLHWRDNLAGTTMLEHAVAKMAAGIVDPREVADKVGPFESLDSARLEIVFGGEPPVPILAPARQAAIQRRETLEAVPGE